MFAPVQQGLTRLLPAGRRVRPRFEEMGVARANLALQLLMVLVWLVETSDVDGRSYLAWAWFRGRLWSTRLDLDQAATRH